MQEADISGYISNGEWDLVGKLSIPYLHCELAAFSPLLKWMECQLGMKTAIKLINDLASGIWNPWEQISDANQHLKK